MKYVVSIAISLALFLVFRPNQQYTIVIWSYLLLMHAPVALLLFAVERKRKMTINPFLCFACIWIGGLVTGYTIGPSVIKLMPHKTPSEATPSQ